MKHFIIMWYVLWLGICVLIIYEETATQTWSWYDWMQSKEWLNDTLFAERTCIFAFPAYKKGSCLIIMWHDSCSLMGCQTQIKTDEFKFRSVPFDYVLIEISLTLHISRVEKISGQYHMQVHGKQLVSAYTVLAHVCTYLVS